MIGSNRAQQAASLQVRAGSGPTSQVDQVPSEFELYFDV